MEQKIILFTDVQSEFAANQLEVIINGIKGSNINLIFVWVETFVFLDKISFILVKLFEFFWRKSHFAAIWFSFINPLTLDVHKKVIHTEKNMHLIAAGLFKYLWPCSGHQTFRGEIHYCIGYSLCLMFYYFCLILFTDE